MVKLDEHIKKMNNIKAQVDKSKGKQKLQLMKCLHRMQKELLQCQLNLEMK